MKRTSITKYIMNNYKKIYETSVGSSDKMGLIRTEIIEVLQKYLSDRYAYACFNDLKDLIDECYAAGARESIE